MKKIDIHLHLKQDDPLLDQYIDTMKKGETAAGLVHGFNKDYGSNECVRKACEKHKEKLFGSVLLDFRQPAAEVIAEAKAYAAAGFKSIKLFPNYGYNPSDPRFDKIWDAVEELGLLCLSHCGWLGTWEMKEVDQLTAHPFCFERAARNHPGINFIMAHFGGGAYYLETCVLTLRLPNLFADTCPGWGKWVFDQRLPGLNGLDFKKILYGTDNCLLGNDYDIDEQYWVATHKAMGRSPEDLERYFYGNAAKLLKLA